MSGFDIEAPDEVRNRLCLALDTDDMVEALRRARSIGPWFGTVKIGLELFSSSGPSAIAELQSLGLDVFVDLKLHDIPTTVYRAARVLGSLGIAHLTLHAQGGADMLRAGVEGAHEGAEAAQVPAPRVLAVTVLTSDDTAPPHIVPQRVRTATETGCDGLVCAVEDVGEARSISPQLYVAATGIRALGDPQHDQRRVATPGDAFSAGADLLVIGRSITEASDPVKTAADLVDSALS